jgi:hypothetical protein
MVDFLLFIETLQLGHHFLERFALYSLLFKLHLIFTVPSQNPEQAAIGMSQ